MRLFEDSPALVETLISLGILLGSYLAARLLSTLLGRLIAPPDGGPGSLENRLASAVKDPLTNALFLVGAYAALHRLPIQDRWLDRIDGALFVLGVLFLTLALLRSYGILLRWYTTESRHAASEGLAAEFGPLFSKVGKLVIVLVAVITVFHRYNINVSSLVVSLGVGSLAVGLAAQDTLANMFAGFTLMVDRPFRIGDRIQLGTGEIGDVAAIGIRSTRIKTTDETILIVPNSALVKDRLVNQTRPDRHVTTRIEVGVGYGTDLDEARRILLASVAAVEQADPRFPPVVHVTKFGDWAVNLKLVFWTRDYSEQALAVSRVHEEIYRRLRDAGIELPLPTQRVVEQREANENEKREV